MLDAAKRLLRAVLFAATVTAAAGPALAAPIPCGPGGNPLLQYAQAKQDYEIEQISRDEAATAEAMDAARQCLANIARLINQIAIPSVSFSVDFTGILRNMINRACQVVTTKIDQTGRVINGTISGAANRFIGDVNSAINLPPGTGNVVTGGTTSSVATPGINGTSMGGTASTPGVQAGLWNRLMCGIRGNCP